MKEYLDIVKDVLANGKRKENRTGTAAISLPGAFFRHDMAEGFPLLTTKKMPFKLVASELEFFIKGITSKKWLTDRNNHIWDEWCSSDAIKDDGTEETRAAIMREEELGPIYGWQWRHFGGRYVSCRDNSDPGGVDQLGQLIDTIKTDPNSRRMLVSAWNPSDLKRMALPPCHYAFQVTVTDGRVNLFWNQRSVDVALGLPFNIASYGLLLHLIAREANLEEGHLVGFLADTHIYANHEDNLRLQLEREPMPPPSVRTEPFSSIFEWRGTDTALLEYRSHPRIDFEIAV